MYIICVYAKRPAKVRGAARTNTAQKLSFTILQKKVFVELIFSLFVFFPLA